MSSRLLRQLYLTSILLYFAILSKGDRSCVFISRAISDSGERPFQIEYVISARLPIVHEHPDTGDWGQ